MVDEKALFGFHVGCNGAKQRRLGLVGPVGAAETLDRGIGLPAGFKEIVHAQTPVPGRQFGMVAAPRTTGVREHQNALDVIHERCGLDEVRRAGTALDHETVTLANDPPRASGDFSDDIGPETLNDLVERAGHRRKRSQFLDQTVASRDGIPALDRLAVATDRAGRRLPSEW